MTMPNKLYDALKWLALVGLPAFSAAYFSLAGVWGLPYAEQVIGTAAIVGTLLGALLGLSNRAYNNSDGRFDGNLDVMERDTSLINQLEITTPPSALTDKDSVTFKVRKIPGDIRPEDSPE